MAALEKLTMRISRCHSCFTPPTNREQLLTNALPVYPKLATQAEHAVFEAHNPREVGRQHTRRASAASSRRSRVKRRLGRSTEDVAPPSLCTVRALPRSGCIMIRRYPCLVDLGIAQLYALLVLLQPRLHYSLFIPRGGVDLRTLPLVFEASQ